jgi:thiol-disulfide isomerase/thioredoxin
MTAGHRTAAIGAGRSSRFAAERWLAGGLLVMALTGLAHGEAPTLTSLLARLDLRPYASRTVAPPWTGAVFDGQSLSLDELHGKVVLLNFWASWCKECRPEMPLLERIHREFAPRGLAVIGINARESRETVRRYAKELELGFPLVLDPDGKIAAGYGVVALPTTFLVARDGRAIALGVGPREWQSAPARSIIDALLSEPAPSQAHHE